MNEKKTMDALLETLYSEAALEAARKLGDGMGEPAEAHEFSAAHERGMNHLLSRERNAPRLKRLARISRRVAIALLALIVAGSATVFSVEALRVRVLNMIVESREKNTDISFESEGARSYTGDALSLGYIPAGFEPIQTDSSFVLFQNGDAYFSISAVSPTSKINIDTENADTKPVSINGSEGYFSTNDNSNILVWHDGFYVYTMIGNINENELQKIAELTKLKE